MMKNNFNLVQFYMRYSIPTSLRSTIVDANIVNTYSIVRHNGTRLATTGLIGAGVGIGYPFRVKYFSTSRMKLAEEDKGKRKASEKELEQMEIENQKSITEDSYNLDEQERKDLQKAMKDSKKDKEFIENSSNMSNQQMGNYNTAGPSNQESGTYETTVITSEQGDNPEVTDLPSEQVGNSESDPKYDTLDKFAKTPVYVSDPEDKLDPEYAFSRGIQAESIKSSKVWDELDVVEISDPKSNFIPKYMERQNARYNEAIEQANAWSGSDEEKQFHRGRAAAIREMLEESEPKWSELESMFYTEQQETDEGLGKSLTPSATDSEEELSVSSDQNSQEASQDEEELLAISGQNSQEELQDSEAEGEPVSENVEAEGEPATENTEATNEIGPDSGEADTTKKRKRDSDDEGDGPSGGGISPSNWGPDDYPDNNPDPDSNSNQKVIFLIFSIIGAICDAFNNLPF